MPLWRWSFMEVRKQDEDEVRREVSRVSCDTIDR